MTHYQQERGHSPTPQTSNRASIHSAISRLDDWLLGEEVCNSDGKVAGVVEHGEVKYWYTEMSGYYLSYLAYLSTGGARDRAALSEKTRLVSSSLRRQWNLATHPTRQYTNQGSDDWRNHWRFSFDIAMVLRGLADAASQSLSLDWDGESAARDLYSFCDTAVGIRAAIPRDTGIQSSPKWSLNAGAYQWKTASAILRYASVFDDRELDGLARTLMERLSQYGNRPTDWGLPPHATLYGIEGLDDCSQTTHDGWLLSLSEYLVDGHQIDKECQRTDVMAQCLRLLSARKLASGHCERLATRLLTSVSPAGRTGFRPGTHDPASIWCGMFVRQGLAALIGTDGTGRSAISSYI